MEVKKFEETMGSNMYCIKNNDEFLIVDPSQDPKIVEQYIGAFYFKNSKNNENSQKNANFNDFLAKKQVHSTVHSMHSTHKTCVGVFITHCHYDHILFIEEFAKLGATFYLTKQCWYNIQNDIINCSKYMLKNPINFTIPKDQVVFIDDDDKIYIDNEYLTVKRTSGHTNCSACIYNDTHIFCGDLLFENGGYGRYDLPTASFEELKKSIAWILTLRKKLFVQTGHGETFLLNDRKNN